MTCCSFQSETRVWKPKIKVMTGLVFPGTSLSLACDWGACVLHDHFSMGSHPWCHFLFLDGHQPYWIRTPPLWLLLILTTSLKVQLHLVTLEVRALTCGCGGHIRSLMASSFYQAAPDMVVSSPSLSHCSDVIFSMMPSWGPYFKLHPLP